MIIQLTEPCVVITKAEYDKLVRDADSAQSAVVPNMLPGTSIARKAHYWYVTREYPNPTYEFPDTLENALKFIAAACDPPVQDFVCDEIPEEEVHGVIVLSDR
jgi:hypothetical protein